MGKFGVTAFVSAGLSLLLLLALSATAGAVAGHSHGGDGEALPAFDIREERKQEGSASVRAQRSQARLSEEYGAQGFVDPGTTPGTVGFVGRTDGLLTPPSGDSPRNVVLDFVGSERRVFGLTPDDIDSLELVEAYTSEPDGVRHLTFHQIVDGVPSYDSLVYGNVTDQGELVNVSGGPIGRLTLDDPTPEISRDNALRLARWDVGGDPEAEISPTESIRKVAFAEPDGSAELAWAIYVESSDQILYEVVIGADSGKVLSRQVRTAHVDQATVWNNHPDQTVAPDTVNLGADPSWIDDDAGGTRLKGNNTHAYADDSSPNGFNAGEDIPQVSGDWLFPISFTNQAGCPAFGCTWDSSNNATKATNRSAAVTGLFYLTNKFHDHLLQPPISFNEASRNFERVNSTGQGLGNDHVLAEGNDSSSTNNANFATPPDGSSGRMQQFFFNFTYDVNSTDSAEVVYHEYAHGLTNRLVQNADGLDTVQSRAMGEGWSDWYAMDLLVLEGEKVDGPGVDLEFGTYTGDFFLGGSTGIRRQAMDCDPASTGSPLCAASGGSGPGGLTYGDLGNVASPGSVHDNGEIWGQTLWDLREALGRNDALAIVTGGLRLSPVDPSFLDMRDAILQSAITLGVSLDQVWGVFAARGMGFSASTFASNSFISTEAFDLPPALLLNSQIVNDSPPLGDGDGFVEPGESVKLGGTLSNPRSATHTNVRGTLDSTLGSLFIGEEEASWPNIPSTFAPVTNDTPLVATVPESVSCGTDLGLTMNVSSSVGNFPFPLDLALDPPNLASANPNLAIPDNNDPGGIDTQIAMPAGPVTDINVRIDSLTHPNITDIELRLTSPEGTTVLLIADEGFSGDNMVGLVLDDDADGPVTAANPPFTGRFQPEQALSAFNGEEAGGTWTLNVVDDLGGNIGTLDSWGLENGLDCSTNVRPPDPVTGGTSDVEANGADLEGTVDPNGNATSYRFEYGTGGDTDQTTSPSAVGAGDSPVPTTAAVSGLSPETTYTYRVAALRGDTVVARGAKKTFETAAAGDSKECATAKKKLKKAKKKLKKAKKKLKKAKKKGSKAKVKKAKKKVKKAKKKVKQAKKRQKAVC